MNATEVQSLLRFLISAKVPSATALSKIKQLREANLESPEKLAKSKTAAINAIFEDEKLSKQILTAARRVAKKRAAGDDDETTASPSKKRKENLFSEDVVAPAELESSLALPISSVDEEELAKVVVFTNRAPLVLAFAVTLLKHTMPEQPLSSRLSLAQAYVSTTSRARAVNLGIESGKSAEEEGHGDGQPSVTIMGKKLRVMRRWGYEWRGEVEEWEGKGKGEEEDAKVESGGAVEREVKVEDGEAVEREVKVGDEEIANNDAPEEPALWGLDLEALKKSGVSGPVVTKSRSGATSSLPIYTPQSARAYLLKSFDDPPSDPNDGAKKTSAAARVAAKERNLGHLLRALDLLYESWAPVLSPAEMDQRTFGGWYVKVRPAVQDGVAGWGGKNTLRIAEILALRRVP